MWSRCYRALLALALVVAGVPAQEKTDKPAPSARPDANAVEVRFADDSTVKMTLQHASIEVATRYGKLTVPVSEIRRIDFGLRVTEETQKRIDTAITRLASQDFKLREAAGADLLALKELAYPAVLKATKSADLEVARRAKEVLKTITETVPEERLHPARHDTVVTLDFTITGQVEASTLKAKGPYFGETTLKLSDLRSMRLLATDRDTSLAINAALHGGQNETWLDTGVTIRAGSGLRIAASGAVDLRPGGGGDGISTLVTPDGLTRSRTGGFGGGRGGPGGGRGGFPGGGGGGGIGGGGDRTTVPATPQPGALIGRIGEQGRVFFVGSRFEGNAAEEGKLYLRIVPSPTGESTGSYDVRVSLGR